MTSTLFELFQTQAEQRGDQVAVQGLNAADLTYRSFMAQLNRIIETLAAYGLGPGDRVIIQLPNGPEAFVMMHGVGALAVAMLIDARASAVEVEYFMRFVEPKAILLARGLETSGRAVAQSLGVPIIEIVPAPELGAGTLEFAETPSTVTAPTLNGPDDLAYLATTSGTTALPKLIPYTQTTMVHAIRPPLVIQQAALGETVPLRAVNMIPLHLIYGAAVAAAALISGGSVACMPGIDPDRIYDWLDTYRPIVLVGPPSVLEQLLALAPDNPDVLAQHSIRYINAAAAPLSDATRTGFNRLFNVPIAHTYGSTELGIVSLLVLPAGSTDSVTNVGRPNDFAPTRIMNADGTFQPVGQVGEVVVRPPVFTGYWRNPEADAEAFVDGWLRTGDEGILDADGNLTIVGRVKEVINSGGAKVSPQEVEAVLMQHPQVKEVAVFGLKSADVGETVAAAVVGDVTERELRKFASERLPFFKVPTRIMIVEAIPRTASGKLQRNRIAEILGLT